MESLLILFAVIGILTLILAILRVIKSFVNSNVAANEAILAELREIRKLLEKRD